MVETINTSLPRLNVREAADSHRMNFSEISNAVEGEICSPVGPGYFSGKSIFSNYVVHKHMADSAVALYGETVTKPLCYVRLHNYFSNSSVNSSRDVGITVHKHYEKIENQLQRLASHRGNSEIVEQGAVHSAVAVISELKKFQIYPPRLSWHGGDAIVMLWLVADTTYAITITEGELAYVVRRNKSVIKEKDSIEIDAFNPSVLTGQ